MLVKFLTLPLFLFWAALPAAAVELDGLLAQMDAASAKFRSMKAEVDWVKYTAIVDIQSVDQGEIVVRRNSAKSVDLKISFREPYEYYVLVRQTKAEIYKPKVAQVEEYDLSKNRAKLEQALLVGFGVSGEYLRENYELKLLGNEAAAGVETVKIELIPKSPDTLKNIPRMEMWISTERWQPVQQKIYETNPGDYRLYTYTDIVWNAPVKDSDFELKIPKSVKRIHPLR